MEINLDDLHQISDKLFQNLKDKGINSVNLQVDYYWNIPQSQIYNPLQEPVELDLGQLSDDLNELMKIFKSIKEPLGYDFVWLASILRAVGENIWV